MNNYLQDLLISPATSYPLSLTATSDECLKNGHLVGKDSIDVFDIVNGIPILLPYNQVADYQHNVLEILYKEHTNEICNELLLKTNSNYDLYKDEIIKRILNDFGKEGILSAFEKYGDLPLNQKLCWYAQLENSQEIGKTQIPLSSLSSGLSYATIEIGKKRMEMYYEMKMKWALHLNDYGKLVTEKNPNIIVEISTGAGLGTCGVIKNYFDNSKLISIDIDYACASNAKGIAKYTNLECNIDPVVANFWYLPLKDKSIDVVCSHYGLDESRELPITLSEISRILKDGGEFINVSRKDPTDRIKQIFNDFNFSDEECVKLIHYAGFYGGMDDLEKAAKMYDLSLNYQKIYSPDNSHSRVLSVFRKG